MTYNVRIMSKKEFYIINFPNFFFLSIGQGNRSTTRITRLVYKWTFITPLNIIIISDIYIIIFVMTSSITIKQKIKYWFKKYMEIYDKNDNNIYGIICFCTYLYYICNLCILESIKIAQIVQEVVINLFCYVNIDFVFVWMLNFVQVGANILCTRKFATQTYNL